MIPAAQDWNRHRFPERCEVSLDRLLDLVGELMPRDEDRDLRPDAATSDVVEVQIKDAVLRSLLRLIVGSPLHRLLRLPEARRALHQQPPDRRPVLANQPPEEKPLNDLAQLLLGFLSGEEGRAGGWRQAVQGGPGIARAVESGAPPITADRAEPKLLPVR